MTDTFTSEDSVTTGGDTGSGQTPGSNPAWNDVLSVLPEQFHPVVTPHFQKWDQAAQDRITSLNTELGTYKQQYEPYASLAQYGVSIDDISQGLRLMQAMSNNPRELYDALGKAYGYDVANQQLAAGNIPGAENASVQQMTGQQEPQQQYYDPRFDPNQMQRLQQGVDLMANMLVAQQNEANAAQADADLDTELNTLRTQHGDFDERFVLSYMQAGMTGEQAVTHFNQLKNELLTNNPRPFAPGVLGSQSGGGSGMPSDAIDVTKLNGKETRSLVVQMLEAAQRGQR